MHPKQVSKPSFPSSRGIHQNFIHAPSILTNSAPAEINYDMGNRESLAIKLALKEWIHWLEGARHPFTVFTDHKNLQYLCDAKRLNPIRHAGHYLSQDLTSPSSTAQETRTIRQMLSPVYTYLMKKPSLRKPYYQTVSLSIPFNGVKLTLFPTHHRMLHWAVLLTTSMYQLITENLSSLRHT